MDLKIIFSPTAIRDLAESVSYVSRLDSEAAVRIGDGMIAASENHRSSQPFLGPVCSEYPGTNIRYWLYQDYRIVYEVNETEGAVHILRFWHCSPGDWPVDLEQ